MLVLDAQSPGSVAYNVQDALRLAGDVDAAALQVLPTALVLFIRGFRVFRVLGYEFFCAAPA